MGWMHVTPRTNPGLTIWYSVESIPPLRPNSPLENFWKKTNFPENGGTLIVWINVQVHAPVHTRCRLDRDPLIRKFEKIFKKLASQCCEMPRTPHGTFNCRAVTGRQIWFPASKSGMEHTHTPTWTLFPYFVESSIIIQQDTGQYWFYKLTRYSLKSWFQWVENGGKLLKYLLRRFSCTPARLITCFVIMC